METKNIVGPFVIVATYIMNAHQKTWKGSALKRRVLSIKYGMLESLARQTRYPSDLTKKAIDRVVTFQTPTMLTAETATTHSKLNSSGPSSFRSNRSAFTTEHWSHQTRMQ